MKKIFTPLLLSSVLVLANTIDLSWVDKQIEAIKPPREGESMKNISQIKNPFVFLSNNEEKTKGSAKKSENSEKNKEALKQQKSVVFSKNSFLLGAIINKTALINNKWYRVGDIVNGYTIVSIDKKTVNLKNASLSKILTTKTQNTKLKFKDR